MSSMHGLYSVGILAGAASGGLAAELGVSQLAHFSLVAVLIGCGGAAVLRGLLADRPVRVPVAAGQGRGSARPPGARGWSPAVLVLGAVGFATLVGEGAAADWSAVYLRDHLHTGEGMAAAALSAFSLAMAGTRFVVDRLSARWGPVAVVRTGGLVAAAGLGSGLLVSEPVMAVAGFALFGAGLAPAIPIAFSAAGNSGDGSSDGESNGALARAVTISYLGATSGPAQIGLLTGWLTLRGALFLPVVLALGVAVLASGVSSSPDGIRRR